MQVQQCSDISCYEVAVEMMNLYSRFFAIVTYLISSDDRVRTVREQLFKSSVIRNYSELEDEYQNRLLISFGEHANVKAMRPLTRPKLKHQLTLLNAWNHTFDAFGTIEVFLAGMGISTGCGQAVNKKEFREAKSRILSAIRVLRQDCLSLIDASHISEGTLLEYAHAVVIGIDLDRIFE